MIKVIFIIISIFIVWAIRYIRNRKKNNSLYAIPNQIKENYKKVSIPLNKINVQTRGYYKSDEESLYPTRMRVLDALVDKAEVNKVYKEVSTLTYDGLLIRGKSVLLKSVPAYLPEVLLHQKFCLHFVVSLLCRCSNFNEAIAAAYKCRCPESFRDFSPASSK